jgi:tetraacyldisaccharide 4'-kinase
VNGLERIYRHFYRKRRRAAEKNCSAFEEVAVFSVGNLTTGGTGKTPTVQWLARRLLAEGLKVAAVARGYGGQYSARGALVANGEKLLLNAQQAGDEALLHARALPGVAVAIGRDRVAAVKSVVESFAPDAVVLDDGFQYWSLERDFDLVLLDARRPLGNGQLLPTGRLREPCEELRRADAVLLTRAEHTSQAEREQTQKLVENLTDAPCFFASHQVVAVRDEASGARCALEEFAKRRVAALAALADNAGFFQSLQAHGMQMVSALSRRDHHCWRQSEVESFARRAQELRAEAILTTEKDAVKLDAAWARVLPIYSVVIEVHIEDEAELWKRMRSALVKKNLVPEP